MEGGNKLKDGDMAPEFELTDAQGGTRRLSEFAGKKLVLYFYPKDDTPGCTVEACDFTARLGQMEKAGAIVVGVSPDGAESHARFAAKYKLRHLLLSDPKHEAAQAYGAWGDKKFMGKSFAGIRRSTFVIDGKGRVAHALYDVSPAGHAEQILQLLGKI
ncbi:MAG: thioredoxin-dependent thiol peroxidase [Candidatus Marsarchaeota archaeon]|nr:thioredoxin-dependent thiol peroxidase [Candidatus Marsarchaeota archaeon]